MFTSIEANLFWVVIYGKKKVESYKEMGRKLALKFWNLWILLYFSFVSLI